MASVYENAIEVRIWLGSISDVSIPTPDVREQLEKYQSGQVPIPSRSSHSFLSPEEDTGAVLTSKGRVIQKILLAARAYVMEEGHLLRQKTGDNWFPDELESLGLRIIASQPWWRRVWVIQEATLAKQDPVMQCGHVGIRYRRFLESTKNCMLQDAPLQLSRTHISLVVHGMFDNAHNPSKAAQASRLLTYLSCMSGNFEATDPMNRVNGVAGMLRMGNCHDNIFFLMTRDQCKRNVAEFFHRVAIWILFDPQLRTYPLRILESGPSNIEWIPSWVPMWEPKKWIGEDKNYGASESKYDLLAQGTTIGKRYHESSLGVCGRCSGMYEQKWGAPKSIFDIDVRCTEIRIRDALALGKLITTVEVLPVPEKQDIYVLREAIIEVEERILRALKSTKKRHSDAKTHIQRFRDFLRLNFWDVDEREVSGSSEHSTTLEDFLHGKRKSRKKKRQRRGRKVSAHQADPNFPNPSSIAKLSSFFGHVSYLVVGSEFVGHIFEDTLPSWRCGDRLFLISECRWVLGLRRSGNGYQYMYRVFVSDLEWQQRKQLFDGKGIYENIVLV
jgi:hypothetical protein